MPGLQERSSGGRASLCFQIAEHPPSVFSVLLSNPSELNPIAQTCKQVQRRHTASRGPVELGSRSHPHRQNGAQGWSGGGAGDDPTAGQFLSPLCKITTLRSPQLSFSQGSETPITILACVRPFPQRLLVPYIVVKSSRDPRSGLRLMFAARSMPPWPVRLPRCKARSPSVHILPTAASPCPRTPNATSPTGRSAAPAVFFRSLAGANHRLQSGASRGSRLPPAAGQQARAPGRRGGAEGLRAGGRGLRGEAQRAFYSNLFRVSRICMKNV